MPTIKLHVQSEIHEDDEYGARVNQNGKHSGGPFVIQVSPKMTVEDLRLEIKVSPPLILSLYLSISAKAGSLNYITRALPSPPPSSQDKGGIIPGMQKLAYAGKKLDDPKRTLEQ